MSIEYLRLGDIATYINGYAFKPEDWSTKGRPIIRIQNLTNSNNEVNFYSKSIDEKYIVKQGDILISWSASIGVYEWSNEEAVLNQHIFKVKFDKIIINKDYFKFIVPLCLQRAMKFMHGSTMKHITKKYFDDILVPIPKLNMQKKIANTLDKVQDLIDKRKAQIEDLDELVKSRFIGMFGDPILNQKGWETCELREGIKEIKYGTSTPPEFSEEGIPFVRATNIKVGRIIKNDMKYISADEAAKIEKCKLELGDTIVVRSGANTGDNAYVTEEYVGAYGGYDIIIRLNNKFNYVFLNALLNSSYRDVIIQPLTRRAGQPHLNSEQIQSLVIFNPPIDLQNQFAAFVNQVDKLKFEMENSLKELEDTFNSLMQKAFSGELFN